MAQDEMGCFRPLIEPSISLPCRYPRTWTRVSLLNLTSLSSLRNVSVRIPSSLYKVDCLRSTPHRFRYHKHSDGFTAIYLSYQHLFTYEYDTPNISFKVQTFYVYKWQHTKITSPRSFISN